MSGPRSERDAAPQPGAAATPDAAASSPADAPGDPAGDASLLALVDRLAGLLERSDLTELEVEAGGTGLILRKPGAFMIAEGRAALPVAAPAGRPWDVAGAEHPATGMSGGAVSSPGSGSDATAGAGARAVHAHAADKDERPRLWAMQATYDKDLEGYAARRSRETAVVILSPRPE